MIICKSCGKESEYIGKRCSVCSAEHLFDEAYLADVRRRLNEAKRAKKASEIYEYRHLLADFGTMEEVRSFASYLEGADSALRDIDGAMEYYYVGAKRNDPFSSYRFSKLIGRRNEAASRFWLKYSALLGCGEAYSDVAALHSSEGNEELAAYFHCLCAERGDTDSIVSMAKRWYDGVGVEVNQGYAKWYLDKLTIPPISAIKLAYKLRSQKAEPAPQIFFPEYRKYLRALAQDAQNLGEMNAYYKINCLLRNEGDVNAETVVGVLLAEGQGTEANRASAKETLDSAIARGNAAAAVYLAECFAEGRCFDKSPSLAIEYYVKAGALGFISAYEKLGDIYALGELDERNPKLAVEYYELASALPSAEKKANDIKAKRKAYYESGLKILRSGTANAREAQDSFRSLAVATAMGETEAAVALADCYRLGFGTKRDASSSFYWYRSAYDEGATSALMPLALCYSRGEGVAFSYRTAVKYLSIAQSRGIPGAAAELDKLYRRRMKKMIRSLYSVAMSLIHQKKLSEAFSLLLESAPLGYPKTLYTLGCFYEFGAGIGRSDKISAAKYYELALKGNDNFEKFSDPMSKYKLKVLKMIR